MQIVLASNNAGKLAELQAMFAPLSVTLVRQGDLGIPEAEEPFRTFVENALAKARNAAQHSGLPAVADDAGLLNAERVHQIRLRFDHIGNRHERKAQRERFAIRCR